MNEFVSFLFYMYHLLYHHIICECVCILYFVCLLCRHICEYMCILFLCLYHHNNSVWMNVILFYVYVLYNNICERVCILFYTCIYCIVIYVIACVYSSFCMSCTSINLYIWMLMHPLRYVCHCTIKVECVCVCMLFFVYVVYHHILCEYVCIIFCVFILYHRIILCEYNLLCVSFSMCVSLVPSYTM